MQRHDVRLLISARAGARFSSPASRVRRSRVRIVGLALFLSIAMGFVASRPASAQISQVDIGTFTNTGNQVTDIPAFTVNSGANVLVVNLSWRTPTIQTAGGN